MFQVSDGYERTDEDWTKVSDTQNEIEYNNPKNIPQDNKNNNPFTYWIELDAVRNNVYSQKSKSNHEAFPIAKNWGELSDWIKLWWCVDRQDRI